MPFVQNTEHEGTKFHAKVDDDDNDRKTCQINVEQHPPRALLFSLPGMVSMLSMLSCST